MVTGDSDTGKYRYCWLKDGHKGRHKTVYCGKAILWPNERTVKKRYVRLTQMGVSSVQPLEHAILEIREAHEHALTSDVLEVRFMDLTDAEYEALPEFQGY